MAVPPAAGFDRMCAGVVPIFCALGTTVSSPNHQGDPHGHRLDDAVLAALFSQSPVGLHVLDTQLRLVRVNVAARRIRDFLDPVDQLVGRPLRDVLDAFGVDRPEFIERTARNVLETGSPVLDLHFYLRSRRDPAVEAMVSAACFRLQDSDGTVLGLAVALTDITASARAETRMRLLSQAAASVGTTLDIFRTAEELCDIAAPELADAVTVDVIDSVLRGEAPAPVAATETVPLRRAGFRSAADDTEQGLATVGEAGTYPFGTPYMQALSGLAPVLIRHLDADTDWLDPARKLDARLLAAGVHSMLVMPMRARGVVLGLTCLYRWRNPIPFDRDDLALVELLTSRAALSLDNARVYSRERSVARILQRELGRPESAVCSAVETAHAYLPTGAGGGWFDVIPLSGARVALVVGDTIGRPLNAAAAMGQLRAAVAALSGLDLPPDEILERLHDLASWPLSLPKATTRGETLDHAWSATCLYAAYDPVIGNCTISSAGHPPLVVVHTSGKVELLDIPTGPPLGQGIAQYTVVECTLPEGSTLLLYNTALLGNGLDPGRPPVLLERLREVTNTASLQDMCDAIVDALAPRQPQRDAVLLLARTQTLDAAQTASWTLPNAPEVVSQARKLAITQLTDWGMDDLADGTALIVSELVTNAVRYAEGAIELRLIRDQALICEVTDDSSTAPHLRRADDSDEGGRGLYITAQLTDRWGVRPAPRGKTIWAEQPIRHPAPDPAQAHQS
ncbi:SpoIIE family protein phosphatase [Streptomyces adustus]|uniref:SpoIIE family protein phosphatase n=1 Tax=Streptomyces adustus TaxID=1609272 RepID=UPI0035D67B71